MQSYVPHVVYERYKSALRFCFDFKWTFWNSGQEKANHLRFPNEPFLIAERAFALWLSAADGKPTANSLWIRWPSFQQFRLFPVDLSLRLSTHNLAPFQVVLVQTLQSIVPSKFYVDLRMRSDLIWDGELLESDNIMTYANGKSRCIWYLSVSSKICEKCVLLLQNR